MRNFIIVILFLFCLTACKGKQSSVLQESTTSGTIRISADESFKPILEEEFKMFRASYPNANLIVEYKPESECLKDLMKDSTRMVFVTKGLSESENEIFKDKLGYSPRFSILAYNAIAIVVNEKSLDTLFTLKSLKEKLTGINTQTVVLDGSHMTGVNRFLKDSLLKEMAFGKNVIAANGSDVVINYVKKHPDAMGFVAMNWINDTYDPKQIEYRKFIKTAMLKCTLCAEKNLYAQPSPATIGKGQYSLSLPIYYILKENFDGLGSGLVNFLSAERGQLIFRRAFLVPAIMSFTERNTVVNTGN
jgi:phosphate transport system substrate-binding protein